MQDSDFDRPAAKRPLAHRNASVALLPVLCAMGACGPDISVDQTETGALRPPPHIEFDPANGLIPLPNNLLLDPATGRVSLPPSCTEAPDSAEQHTRLALNQLDGFGTSRMALTLSTSEPVDLDSLEGRLVIVRLADHGRPLQALEAPLALSLLSTQTQRPSADCSDSTSVSQVLIQPDLPLRSSSTYGVYVLAGAETEQGVALQPSSTWALVRQSTPPVQLSANESGQQTVVLNATPFDANEEAGLQALTGLERLWSAHASVLQAFDTFAPGLPSSSDALSRSDLLLAWSFNTQTVEDPLNPAVEGGPAAHLTSETTGDKLEGLLPLAGADAPLTVEELFGSAFPDVGCEALGCAAIGQIYASAPGLPGPSFQSPSFQSMEDCDPTTDAHGGVWSDPVHPEATCNQTIAITVVTPESEPPASGFPVALFAHGLSRSKEDVLAIAGALASAGIASVAMDAVLHGSRAVQVQSDPELGCLNTGEGNTCDGELSPSCAPQCFASILSSDLAQSRDNLRQTSLDQLKLLDVLKVCSETGQCSVLNLDANRIGYIGQSMGALIGGVTLAGSELRAGILNVGGGDWFEILSASQTPEIRCPLVDGLIDSGTLEGFRWGLDGNPRALCLTDTWQQEPAFLQFQQAGRWLLDPADAVNFGAAYRRDGAPKVLVQLVTGDQVVPNSATEAFARQLGLSPTVSAIATAVPPVPSPAVTDAGSQWLTYSDLSKDSITGFPGNQYSHSSLLQPNPGNAGSLGTAQMQADAIAFLLSHL